MSAAIVALTAFLLAAPAVAQTLSAINGDTFE